jgi:hypothetical protein
MDELSDPMAMVLPTLEAVIVRCPSNAGDSRTVVLFAMGLLLMNLMGLDVPNS